MFSLLHCNLTRLTEIAVSKVTNLSFHFILCFAFCFCW